MGRRLFAAAVSLGMLGPVLAGGGATCCIPIPRVESKHACCQSATTRATAPKGCCRAPAAKHEAAAKDTARLEAASPAPLASPAAVVVRIAAAHALRRARLAHRAEAPDESPPDVLLRTSILLI